MNYFFQNDNLNRKVKPQILSVLGDVALATGVEFKKYLDVILGTLEHATMAHIDKVSISNTTCHILQGLCY